MNAELLTLTAEAKGAWNDRRHDGKVHINVCIDTSSIARGAQETLEALRTAVARDRLNVEVGITGSWGFCWLEPTLTVRSAAGTRTVLYADVTANRVDELLESVTAGRDLDRKSVV